MSYVVYQPADDTYLKHFDPFGPPAPPVFGPLDKAKEYLTLGEAEAVATMINAGTVGTTKP